MQSPIYFSGQVGLFTLLGNISLRFQAVLRIRIRRIRMFLGLLDPDPLVRGVDPDPDPSINKQK
jgi:hypothetical protein